MAGFRIRAPLAIAVVVVVAGIAIPGFAFLDHFESIRVDTECMVNLKVIGGALFEYADKSAGGRFPPLSRVPGKLFCEQEGMSSLHRADRSKLISPAHPDRRRLLPEVATNPSLMFDDHSFWYLGYLVLNPRSMSAFIEDYKTMAQTGKPLIEVDEVWPEYAEAVEKRYGKRTEVWFKHLGKWPDGRPYYAINVDDPLPERQYHLRLEFRLSMERMLHAFVEDENSYKSLFNPGYPLIPLLIERPELHGDGGHVMYLDGHVEFIPYPGKFPMTEEFISSLRELDALGESKSAN